jgi:colanic acid biosynthesis glycosyl transferase WcaI
LSMSRSGSALPDLVVAVEAYAPDESGTAHLTTEFARALHRRGHQVTVVTSTPAATHVEKLQVIRVGVARSRSRSILRRATRMLWSALAIAHTTAKRARHPAVAVTVLGPTLHPQFLSLLLRLRRERTRMVVVVHDLYPDAAIAAGVLSARSVTSRIWGALTAQLLGRADAIISIGGEMTQRIERHYPQSRGRVVTVPHWSVGDSVRAGAKQASSEYSAQRDGDRIIVQYAGNIGLTHGVGTILAAARAVATDDARPLLNIVFFGDGPAAPAVRDAEVETQGLVRFAGRRPRTQQSDFLSFCDVAVLGYAPGMAGVSVPSRLPSVLASGRAVIAIADDETDLARLVRRAGLGWVVAPGDAAELARVLKELPAMSSEIAAMGRRSLAEASLLASVDEAAERYSVLTEGEAVALR